MKSCRALAAVLSLLLAGMAAAQEPEDQNARLARLEKGQEDLGHRMDMLAKAIDDLAWTDAVGELADIGKWRIMGPPDANPKNPTGIGANNPVKFYTYTFVPRDRRPGEKLPLVVLPHGGVHSNFTTYHTHILRELLTQGYVVVAPDYRGSTGYGRSFYELIDYGGREVDDVRAAKEWALRSFDFIDASRVGLVGWSHGGLISLMESFAHPKDYACVFAGVPVSNLVMRMGYIAGYEREFAAPYHIGKTVGQDLQEYKRRSPVWSAEKLAVPLLIHTTPDDEDVNFIEVEHLVQALESAGKTFEYKVFPAGNGGHSHDRLDTPEARAARREIWAFIARYLKPPRPLPEGPL